MRKLLLLVALFVCDSSMAQSPEKFTYQSVIRDEAQNLILDSNVGIQIIIRKDSPSGTIIFKEQHTVTTNQNGLATLEIGSGAVITGMFSSIDWSNGPYFIETGTDPLGGTNFTIIGVSQFLSVPYALHSKTAENVFNDQVDDADNNPTNEIQDISLNGTELSITNGSTIDISALQDGVNDADSDPNNESTRSITSKLCPPLSAYRITGRIFVEKVWYHGTEGFTCLWIRAIFNNISDC